MEVWRCESVNVWVVNYEGQVDLGVLCVEKENSEVRIQLNRQAA